MQDHLTTGNFKAYLNMSNESIQHDLREQVIGTG